MKKKMFDIWKRQKHAKKWKVIKMTFFQKGQKDQNNGHSEKDKVKEKKDRHQKRKKKRHIDKTYKQSK